MFDYKKRLVEYKKYYLKVRELSKEPLAQTSFVLIASLLTVSFFGIFAIKPTLTTIADLLTEIKDKKEINQKLQAKIIALDRVETAYGQIKPKLGVVDKALPQKPEVAQLEQEIEYLIYKNNLLLTSAGFGSFVVVGEEGEDKKEETNKKLKEEAEQETLGGEVKGLPFNLVTGGSYENIKSFLEDLENLDRLVIIETATFSKDTDIKGAELQVTIRAEAFYLEIANL